MTNPESEILSDERESCTTQEAVAKLIGWMRGKIRRKYIDIDKYGAIVPAQLPFLMSLEGTVEDMLDGQWQAARRAFRDAEDGDEAIEIIEGRRDALKAVEKLINKATMYLSDIKEEIERGDSSALEWDSLAEKETGEIHIRIDSLDKWARAKYGISIVESLDINGLNASAVDQQLVPKYRELQEKGWLSPTRAEDLFITLAFFVDAFATPGSGYRSKSGKLFEKPVAAAIAEIAKKANNQCYLPGQKEGAILDRIQEAMRKKRLALPVK